jgi:signal transduction histidine kinase
MRIKKNIVRVSLQQTVDSVIVHDMKNLAFRLSALLQNMDENYDSPMFRQSIAEIIRDTVKKMDGIVTRFRENQKQVVVKLRVDVNQVLNKLLEELPQRKFRGVRMDVTLGEVPAIWADPFYLHNAFQSLIQNGIEAMPDGGALRISTKVILQRKKQKIQIEISDTGVGMTESFVQNDLFTPFATTKEKGLGLGLFTSQQIIALHGGKITVMSTAGSGTTFRIILPVEENGTEENSHH